MNWSHSSRVAAAFLAVAFVAAAPALAVSVSADGVPGEAEVDSTVSANYETTDLYTEYDAWVLQGTTELTNATWTVQLYDQTGARIGRETYTGSSFQQPISAADDVNRVAVTVEGTVPPVENFSYEPAQSVTVSKLSQGQDGGSSDVLESWSTRPYTSSSKDARTAIEDAETAIDDASATGADTTEAEELLDSAVSAYNGGNFDNAVQLANKSAEEASAAAASKQQTSLLIKAGAGVVGLLVVVGGVYWYLNSRETYDKLG